MHTIIDDLGCMLCLLTIILCVAIVVWRTQAQITRGMFL